MNPALSDLIRTHYHTLQGYVSAGMESDKTAEKIFLNANENPYELPGLEGFNRYPEPQPQALLDGYAKLYNVKPDNIVMTRGADEALVILTKLFCEPHKNSVITCPPTFGMYKVDAQTMPAGTVEVPLLKQNGRFALDTNTIISKAIEKSNYVKLIFLCSPNNPTANTFPREDLRRICKETKNHAVVILDETYIEFANAESLAGVIAKHPNLVILRTLSKSYSMAGMRMGSLLCNDTDFIKLIRSKCLDAYPLPHASVEAALKVMNLEIQTLAKENIQKLLSERERLIPLLKELNYVKYIYPSETNFLLVEMKNAKDFVTYCAKQNLILRDFSDKPGTENCIRISIGTPEQNDQLLKLLTSFEKQ